MYSQSNWGNTFKSEEQSTLMQSFISTVSCEGLDDKDFVNQSLCEIDKRIYSKHVHDIQNSSIIQSEIEPNLKYKRKLSIPKNNSLTDAFIRNSLGFDEKYHSVLKPRIAKSYIELLETTREDGQKQRRIDEIKKKFTETNSYIDVCANIKPHYRQPYHTNFRPVVDNEHESYLKTQLIFLERPNNPKITEKQYFDKHLGQVTQKIEELGGMEDVLAKMENSLSQHEIKNFKKKEFLEELKTSPRKNPFYVAPNKNSRISSSQISEKSWLDRSKVMRETFKHKFHMP